MSNIPLLWEMNPEYIKEDKYYCYYPTSLHQKNDSRWYGPGREILIQLKRAKEYTYYLMWGKSLAK